RVGGRSRRRDLRRREVVVVIAVNERFVLALTGAGTGTGGLLGGLAAGRRRGLLSRPAPDWGPRLRPPAVGDRLGLDLRAPLAVSAAPAPLARTLPGPDPPASVSPVPRDALRPLPPDPASASGPVSAEAVAGPPSAPRPRRARLPRAGGDSAPTGSAVRF